MSPYVLAIRMSISDINLPITDSAEPEKSDYFNKLVGHIRQRYITKTALIDGIDPYCLCKNSPFFISSNDLPAVSEIDIFAYFAATHSAYSAEQFKAYKSLHANKYVEAGFVENILTFKINDDYNVIVANVRSQNFK